jgi:hypothetical protein
MTTAMPNAFYYTQIITLGLLALQLMSLGAYALFHRRPFLLPELFWSIPLVGPLLLQTILWVIVDWRIGGLIFLASVVLLSLVMCFFLARRRYIFCFVTRSCFHNALGAALTGLGLPFDVGHGSSLSIFRLSTISAELHTTTGSGNGVLWMKGRHHDQLLTRIVRALEAEFAAAGTNTNMRAAIVFLFFGILMLIGSVALVAWRL